MIRREACSACPYRRDAPSGLWSAEEYEKLPPYDLETFDQPMAVFACHATPEHLCHGWAVTGGYKLLALRIYASTHRDEVIEIPEPSTPLFASGTEAAEYGLRDVDAPSAEAAKVGHRLLRKNPRLETA